MADSTFNIAKFADGQTVAFGAGIRQQVRQYVQLTGRSRALVLSTPRQSARALEMAELLGDLAAGIFCKATMHTPVEVSEEALLYLQSISADCVVSVGGGSTIGLGKALALRADVAQVALPTTYAGSECTSILGQTEKGIKTTMKDDKLRPHTVLYDAELVSSLPADITVTSALNAIAHAAEALYARDRSTQSSELALLGIEAFRTSLQAVIDQPNDLPSRERTQYGAWACGAVLGRVGMALHHKLCHTLGGSFNLPHAQTHAIILPHALAYNERAVPELLAPIGEMFSTGGAAVSASAALWEFARALGSPMALSQLGVSESDLDSAARLATTNPYWNPREITRSGVRDLLQRAWSGEPPQSL